VLGSLTRLSTVPLQVIPIGLENDLLKGFLVVLALCVVLWGFKRYRTTFSRVEFGISVLIAVGLIITALFPTLLSAIGNLLQIENSFLVAILLSNSLFILLILFLAKLIRENSTAINELNREIARQQAGETADGKRMIYVVIPAYNEGESIGSVVDGLPRRIGTHSIEPLVVSDGSTDDTVSKLAAIDGTVVEYPVNQGQGTALKTGFEIALERGADVVVTMDGDGQHPPDQLPTLVTPILNDESDFVIGSRFKGVDETENGLVRSGGIRAFTSLINALLKEDFTDCTSGFRAIRGTVLRELQMTEDQFSAPELIIEAKKAGYRITEVPVTIRERASGSSKKPKFGYAYGLVRTIFVTWLR